MSVAPQDVPTGITASESLLYSAASLKAQAEADTKYDVSGGKVENFESEPAPFIERPSVLTTVSALAVAGLAVAAAFIGLSLRKR